jgi:2-oxoisovalerate dehydrogenase E2 component (dihydrolipoyl transacylase)
MPDTTFRLPDLGEGLEEAELLAWRVAEGDDVELNQVIAEVETAKAAVELPSPHAGRVTTLHVKEGDVVPVGSPLITFALPGAGSSEPEPSPVSEEVPLSEPVSEERVPVLVGYGATSGTASRRPRRTTGRDGEQPASARTAPPAALTAATAAVPGQPARPLAKPQVRKLARDMGVDLALVRGSGANGIVTRQDVLDHAAEPAPTFRTEPSDVPTGPTRPTTLPSRRSPLEGDERIPIRGVRRATAEAMVRSAFTAPHVTEFVTVDVTPTMELLNRLRGSAFVDGVKLTPLAFAAKALLAALPENPTLNSSWDGEAQEIVLHGRVNLGIATATPRGLIVPNIKDASRLGLIELARALQDLATTAREGRCTPSDLTGGTISITNVGVFGVDTGTPIINPGEAAILCLGAIRQQPWVHEGELAVRWVTTLSLSFDHRLVDGEQGSRFLSAIATTLATG